MGKATLYEIKVYEIQIQTVSLFCNMFTPFSIWQVIRHGVQEKFVLIKKNVEKWQEL